MERGGQFIALVAAILISGTSLQPEEGVAKAVSLIAAAESAAEKEEGEK